MSKSTVLAVGVEAPVCQRLARLIGGSPLFSSSSLVDVQTVEQASHELAGGSVEQVIVSTSIGRDGIHSLLAPLKESASVSRLALAPHKRDDVGKLLPLVHCVLWETDSDVDLLEPIERTLAVHRQFSSPTLQRLAAGFESLPALPRTYWALVRAISRPDVGVAEVAHILEADPAMSIKILQLANSAIFATSRRMTSIGQAASLLGLDLIKGLTLSAHVFAAFDVKPVVGYSAEAVQSYSVRVARLAKRLLAATPGGDEAFAAGLVLQVGRIVAAIRAPREFEMVVRRIAESGEAMHLVERELLGASHAELGAYLLGYWGLPFSMVEAVIHHHTPSLAPGRNHPVLAAVHAADALLGIYTCADPEDRLDTTFLTRVGFGDQLAHWRELAEAEADCVTV
ncbi:MAG: HDOD domain-containing protein [Acidobacteriota bacterium]